MLALGMVDLPEPDVRGPHQLECQASFINSSEEPLNRVKSTTATLINWRSDLIPSKNMHNWRRKNTTGSMLGRPTCE